MVTLTHQAKMHKAILLLCDNFIISDKPPELMQKPKEVAIIIHMHNLGILGNSGISGDLLAIPAEFVLAGIYDFGVIDSLPELPKCLLGFPELTKILKSWIILAIQLHLSI